LFGPIKEKTKEEEKFNIAVILLYKEFSSFVDYLSKSEMNKKYNIKIELPHKITGED